MGTKFSCLSDGTVSHIDEHTLRAHDLATRNIDNKHPMTLPSNPKRLDSSSAIDLHKQSVFSNHATTMQHSARSSLSLAHPFEHIRLQSVEDKEKTEVEVDEQLKTAVLSSAAISQASSPRQMYAVLSTLEHQSALSRAVTASSLVNASQSPSPSTPSRTVVDQRHALSAKSIIEECKEQQPTVVDSRPVYHQRGLSDSSATIRPVSDAATLTNPPRDTEMRSKRSPYTDAQTRRVHTAVQPSPHHSRRPTLVQATLAPSASSSSLSSASPSASPVSSVVESAIAHASASGHTMPPSVHLTSINLRIAAGGNQSNVPDPCPSPLDLTRSTSAAPLSSSFQSHTVQPQHSIPPPKPKADIHHQLDEVLIFRAITAYHREHRDEGLGPSWWTAHSLVVAGSERERERVRRSERRHWYQRWWWCVLCEWCEWCVWWWWWSWWWSVGW